MAKRFTKEDEEKLPKFHSAEEAFTYFRQELGYGKDFAFKGGRKVAGKECWTCHLVLNPETYRRGIREQRAGTAFRTPGFKESFQCIDLYENGRVMVWY